MPAAAYGRSPSEPATTTMIEAYFDEATISVIWEDETVAEVRGPSG